MKKHHNRIGTHSMPFAAIMGIVISILCVLLLSLAASLLAIKSDDPTSKIGLSSSIVLVMSGIGCGIFVSKFKRDGGVWCAFLCAAAFSAILLLAKPIFGEKISAYSLINAACYFGSAILSAYLTRPRQKKHRY